MSLLALLPPSIRSLVERSAKRLLNEGRFSEEEIETAAWKQTAQAKEAVDQYAKYYDDPVGFAEDVLGLTLTPEQKDGLRLLLVPPYRVLMPSGNEQGKSLAAAVAAIWWHCTRTPAMVLTTAPNKKQVKDILWKEIRRLARKAKLNLPFLPKDCRIERSPDDFCEGKTANDEASFQGQHGPNQLFIVDEAIGCDPWVLEAIEGMFSPPGHALMVLFNPTKVGTWVQQELTRAEKDGKKAWHIVRMSALNHPNIDAELRDKPPPIPHAMRLEKVEFLLKKWSNLVSGLPAHKETNHLATDVCWPPLWATDYCVKTRQLPKYYRPGPLAEARLLGRFPRQGINSVWSDGDWIAASREGLPLLAMTLMVPEIGCDPAQFGIDYTGTHVRCGPKSLYHHEVNGRALEDTADFLTELADKYAKWYMDWYNSMPPAKREQYRQITGKNIPIKIDIDGMGAGLMEMVQHRGYFAVGISSASKPISSHGQKRPIDEHPNRRSELWFTTAERARADDIDLSGILGSKEDPTKPALDDEGNPIRLISEEMIEEIRRQLMAATYSLDNRGRRVVCKKDDMKKELGRSPDGADAVNLAYAEVLTDPDVVGEILYSRQDPFGQHR